MYEMIGIQTPTPPSSPSQQQVLQQMGADLKENAA